MTQASDIIQDAKPPRTKLAKITPQQGRDMAQRYASGTPMQQLLNEYRIKESSFYKHIKLAETPPTQASQVDYKKLYEQAQLALADLYLENKRLKELQA